MKKRILEKGKVVPASFDKVFKAVWHDPKNKKLLSFVLSKLLFLDKNTIYKNLSFKNTELPKEKYEDKGLITDLIMEFLNYIVNFEMNNTDDPGKITKNNYYHHGLVITSTKAGKEPKIVIQVNFNSKLPFNGKSIVNTMMCDEKNTICTDESYITINIYLAKALYKYYNVGKDKLSRLEKIFVMHVTDEISVLEDVSEGDEELMTFKKTIEAMSNDDGIIGLYDKAEMDEFERSQGLQIAKNEGFELGNKHGFELGKENALIETAKKMYKSGMSVNDIYKYTGLSKQKIKSLQTNFN